MEEDREPAGTGGPPLRFRGGSGWGDGKVVVPAVAVVVVVLLLEWLS